MTTHHIMFGLGLVASLGATACDPHPESSDAAAGDLGATIEIDEDSTADDIAGLSRDSAEAILWDIEDGIAGPQDAWDDDQAEAFIDRLQELDIRESVTSADGAEGAELLPTSSLASCSGFWGADHTVRDLRQRNTRRGLLWETGPNCYMDAPGDSCGDDHDDFMLSFWLENHAESLDTLADMLRWYSTSRLARWRFSRMSARIYEQTSGGGRDNYNAYICIDDYWEDKLSTFRVRKY